MQKQSVVRTILGSMLIAGCGGTRATSGHAEAPAQPAAYASGVSAEPATPGSTSESGGVASSPAPAAPAGSASADVRASRSPALESEARAQADERLGLGTSFGETRTSHVSTAPFDRENPLQPFATASLFYNDAAGVRAMARRAGVSELASSFTRVLAGALTVRLLDSNGQPLAGFQAGGRTHVIGEDGERYLIQVQNHTGNRVEAVATVDGLDVIDGRPGAFTKRGYIVAPFATVEIDGFRRSNAEVATFRFGSVSSSYAAKKGDDRNVGIVGVAFFQEAGSRFPWTDQEVLRRHDADPFPGRFSSPPPGSL